MSQSSTYNKIYVDLKILSKPPKTWWEHMHYVAFSRVTKYEGLYIADINKTQICVFKKVSEYLLQAHKNKSLKTLINISSQNKINILFYNT